jgi:hypothetical protein
MDPVMRKVAHELSLSDAQSFTDGTNAPDSPLWCIVPNELSSPPPPPFPCYGVSFRIISLFLSHPLSLHNLITMSCSLHFAALHDDG